MARFTLGRVQVGLRKVAKNKPYLLLLTAFGIGSGGVNAFTTLMGQIVNAQGYSDVSLSHVQRAWISGDINGCRSSTCGAV